MKKSIIAAGAASVALAAMPIVGAFAAVSTVKDAITTTISGGCTIDNTADSGTGADTTVSTNQVAITAISGAVAESNPNDSGYAGVKLVCNAGGWSVSAVGAGEGTHINSLYRYEGTTIQTGVGDEIVAGTATAGESSNWGFMISSISDTTNASVVSGYGTVGTYAAVPTTATPVVNITGISTSLTIKPKYAVYTTNGQTSGTYKGAVNYTIAATV